MDHSNHYHEVPGIKKFLPLIAIFTFISAFTLMQQVLNGWSLPKAMLDFMAAFFLIFGVFKIMKLKHFATAYASYDLLAQHSKIYAYLYPFLEVVLGLFYLVRFELRIVNIAALTLMAISTLGVLIALFKKRKIECACLGTVFKLPMTKVTLLEDLLMLGMAIYMVVMGGQSSSYSIEYDMKHLEENSVELSFHILDEWGAVVTKFDTVHEKPLHLIGVRTDLQEFMHLHPDMNWDGAWTSEVDFPSEGPYQFYADFTPTGGEPQLLTFTMSIGEFTREKLGYYENPQLIEGYSVSYVWPDPIQTGDVTYHIEVQKDEQPVTAFEDYLGAKGHSVIIKEGTLEYQHVHASETSPEFTAHFMNEGRYAVFTQIQIDGQLLTVPYLIYVEQGPEMDDMDHSGH